MRAITLLLICSLMTTLGCSAQEENDKSKYLGQTPPSTTPVVFAPGLISKSNESEFGSVFNKEATKFFYGVDKNGSTEIRFTTLVDNKWITPRTILSNEQYGFNDPFLSPDEKRLYFISQKATAGPGAKRDHDIWYVEQDRDGWSAPINAGPNINSAYEEYYISFTKNGAMYFSSNKKRSNEQQNNFDIYSSAYVDGEFQEAQVLSDAVNTEHYEADVFVDPDEAYIIFCARRPEGLGRGDLYVSFKEADGTWSKSINMGNKINSDSHELCPFVTSDGKYLFYTSNQDIYWVSSTIIFDLK